MATLALQSITRNGVGPTYAAATGGGDACPTGDDVFLHVKNGGGSSITVTLAVIPGAAPFPQTVVTNTVVTVPNAGERMIGPLKSQLYMDPTTGLCQITYSGVTTVTVGVFSNQEP
jgi:hypothetical protein